MLIPTQEFRMDFLEAQACGMLQQHAAPLNYILWCKELSVTMCVIDAGN
jgi:hypothetical protein